MERVQKRVNVRKLAVVAVLGAVASVLMFLEFSIPIVPSFLKLDFSELPALIAAFAFGPLSGVAVCLIKNVVNLLFSSSFGVGSIANFLIGAVFVWTAGFIYQKGKNRKSAMIGVLVGSIIMGVASLFVNYYIVYPIYAQLMTMEKIIQAYQVIYPGVKNLWQALLIFNLPFTIIKGFINAGLTFMLYKKLSPILKGN
ncbi:ECF transporter S component [Scatolibacter rhodanostii]|uniref:ECF transporter S component n=1 Tax=Scatolibacter rhodanostii TaxID=2014781 RepID=UPI000C0820A2|nr:ECF transporter S component [Scatolibacter rhodanostii]